MLYDNKISMYIITVISFLLVSCFSPNPIMAGFSSSKEMGTTQLELCSDLEILNTNNLNSNPVNVAILTEERGWWGRDLLFFKDMLQNYRWIVGNNLYFFNVVLLTDEDILKKKLDIKTFDMLLMAGGAVGDGEAFVRWKPNVENIRWKRNIANFIKDGGGYFSVCGGTCLITDLDKKPRSFFEYAYEKSSLGVSCMKSHYKSVANAIFLQFGGLPSEYIGVAAYGVFTGWNITNFTVNHRGGICQDYRINTSHPIFQDYLENTRKIRWCGGPSIVVPENPDREVSVLAWYPEEEMSENESTKLYAWKYTGGVFGMIKGLIKGFKDRDISEFTYSFSSAYTHAEDWKRTNKIIETDYSNQPAITSEIYPNNNAARIVLSGPHTERNVWWGGHYEEVRDHKHNNLWEGFVKLVGIESKPFLLEWTYNYWLNRRCVAWVSNKVPDDDLPPVYGSSQVKNIHPFIKPSLIEIQGVAELTNGTESLDLYYRHSPDNLSWGEWTYYTSDLDIKDGWSWTFESTDGPGYYQFYSIKHVDYEYEEIIEKPPPGPDASVFLSSYP